MAKQFVFWKMEIVMKANGLVIKKMAKEYICGKIIINTKVNSKMI